MLTRALALQELESEEEKLWKEQVEAAKARAGSEKERYRRIREVRLTVTLCHDDRSSACPKVSG